MSAEYENDSKVYYIPGFMPPHVQLEPSGRFLTTQQSSSDIVMKTT